MDRFYSSVKSRLLVAEVIARIQVGLTFTTSWGHSQYSPVLTFSTLEAGCYLTIKFPKISHELFNNLSNFSSVLSNYLTYVI